MEKGNKHMAFILEKKKHMNKKEEFFSKRRTIGTIDSEEIFDGIEEIKPKQQIMEKKYICIFDDCESMVGTLKEIEDWIDDGEYDADDNLVMYELKSDKQINFKVYKKSSIIIN